MMKFHQLLEMRFNELLQKLEIKELDPKSLRLIRNMFSMQIESIFAKSKFKLSKDALLWLSNQYFKHTKVNDDQTINDYVVINEHKLSEFSNDEITLMRNLFASAEFGKELEQEYKQRNLN